MRRSRRRDLRRGDSSVRLMLTFDPASSSSSWTRSASASCPTRPRTATRAATRSATSRARCRCACRRCARWAWRAWRDIGGDAPAPRGAFGRMAEASPGKDSVTGHWEMMGIVLDRAVSDVSARVSRRADREFERRIGRAHDRQRRRRRARRSSTRSGPSTCAPARRSSTRRPTACFRSPRTRTSIPIDELYRICEVAFELVGARPGRRPRDRAAVRRRARALSRAPPTAATSRSSPSGADAARSARRPPGTPVVGIGKIEDLFAGRGMTRAIHTTSDDHGMDVVERGAGARRRAG